MKEEGQELNQVVVDVAILLLHTDDVRRVVRFVLVNLLVLVEGEESKLEEVLDDYGDLGRDKQ